MQSGFGGVSEIQQFMVDGSAHPFFSISSTTPPPPNSSSSSAAAAAAAGHEIYHPAAFHRPQYPSPPPPPPPHFPHFHSNIPITQQLFTPPPHQHHHFQLFHDHRRLLPSSPSLEQDNPPPPSYLPADMKFKLAADEHTAAAAILHADNASESRLRSWHREESCSIKEPFWRPLDLDYININNKRCKEKESADLHFAKRNRALPAGELENSPHHHLHHHLLQHHHHPGNNYKLFGELEAIYKSEPPTNQTTGSGSALTGDDHPLIPPAAATAAASFDLDYRLEDDNSTGGEAHTNLKKPPHHHSRRRRRRRLHRRQMKSIAAFFQGLMKQLMDHQEALHQKFLNLMEQRDRERVSQEESRRDQESARARREAAARADDRQLAAAREAAVLSFLEKITGETINLPNSAEKTAIVAKVPDFTTSPITNRWPKIEVQALIQVRSGLDCQFQEPGLKGPLWEEVSAAMTALGYNRSSKRCKEKWENINKYFRKSKDSGRKRSLHSKTCPYFHQLDQLYSKGIDRNAKNSELLDAVVVAGGGEEVGESDGRSAAATEEQDEEEEEEEEEEEGEDESSQFVEQLQ